MVYVFDGVDAELAFGDLGEPHLVTFTTPEVFVEGPLRQGDIEPRIIMVMAAGFVMGGGSRTAGQYGNGESESGLGEEITTRREGGHGSGRHPPSLCEAELWRDRGLVLQEKTKRTEVGKFEKENEKEYENDEGWIESGVNLLLLVP